MKKFVIIISLLLLGSLVVAQDLYDINTINTVEITFAESNWDTVLDGLYAAGDEERLVGDVVVNGVEFSSAGIRYKGNSSYSTQNAKNPLNIKLDHVIDDQTYDGYGTLKLSNGYKDPSFVRETLSYEIARNYMPASLANYTVVYINEEFMGLYTNTQSVDKFFKNNHFVTNNDVRFKGEIIGNGMPTSVTVWGYEGADSTSYADVFELKSDTGWDELIEFLDVFNNNPEEMENYLNVDNHLWMLAFDNLMVNLDSPINYGHNYYLFQDGAELFNPIIWDLNENFGVFSMLIGGQHLSESQMQTLDPLLNINDSDYPIVGKVLSIEKYQRMYIAHMRTIIEEIFQSGWYETRAFELQDIISDTYATDPNKFYTFAQLEQNINSTVSSGGGPGGSSVIGLTELMDTRYEWLLDQDVFQGTSPEISNPVASSQALTPDDEVSLTVEITDADNVWMKYRFSQTSKFEEIEMFDDGQHNDSAANDGIYGVSVTVGNGDMQYCFYAENSDLGKFLPARAAYEFYEIEVTTESGELVINEINYKSADDFNTEDWVELYNPGTTGLNVSGWIFKDEDDTHIFEIPENTTISADGYLVLCNDTDAFSALFPGITNIVGNMGFGLSGSGELIRIFDGEGLLIDSVEYGDDAPWPEEADGNGASIELIDHTLDNNLSSSWQASVDHGTPGTQNDASVSSEDDQVEAVPVKLYNYPNPFNPTTTISFELNNETTENTELVIFNTKGQKVITLINESLGTGAHSVAWNGKDENNISVSSGIYFYKLKSGSVSQTKKMILMK